MSNRPLLFIYLFNLFYFWLHWVFVAACRLFSGCCEQGLLFVVVHRLLIVMASLVGSMGSRCTGSVVVAHRLSCSAACGIVPNQGWNPCLLHWQADC